MREVRPRRLQATSSTTKEAVFVAWFFGGWFGAHRFVIGSFAVGGLYVALLVVTFGVGGIVAWVDGLLMLFGTPKDRHGQPVVWSWQRGKLFVDPLEEGSYTPAQSIARIVGHVGAIFVLPYLVVAAGLTLFETSQVKDTVGTFGLLSSLFLGPLFLLQILGTVRKARAQIRMLRKENALTMRTRLDAIARAAAILTPRGVLVLLTGLAFLGLSLAYKWADLGVVAVLALSAFYLATAASSLLSSFIVQRFSSNLLEKGAIVHRSYAPGVARAGDLVKETLDVKGVPVPPGFFLTLSGQLPPRLATEVRHVVPQKSREVRLSLSTLLRRTPRGTYDAAPLRIGFTDLLGLTSCSVPSLATARLRVLPAVRPAEIIAPPASNTEEPDILSRPHKHPTEDLFRFREYVAGDDTRRIHWELSLRAGRMIVKTPDSRESSAKRVVVALDTWLPEDWLVHTAVIDDALDALVEAWLAVGQRLTQQGEKVTLLLVCRAEDGTLRPERIAATSNHAHGLDAGARAEWQSQIRIEDVLDFGVSSDQQGSAAHGVAAFDNAIVVTMRLTPPSMPRVARETTWVHYDPDRALGPMPRSITDLWVDFDDSGRRPTARAIAARVLFLPHPVGAEENGLFARVRSLERKLEDRAHRLALRERAVIAGRNALGALLATPDAVYRLEIQDGRHKLVGLKGSMRGGDRPDHFHPAQQHGAPHPAHQGAR